MEEKTIRVAAIMTAPRYELTMSRNHIERALKAHGIPLTVSGGVFYGQCIQMMLQQLIDLGNVDYAITVDFDSLFTKDHIARLLGWIVQRDDIDAITGLQVRRGKQAMLGTVEDGTVTNAGHKEVKVDGQPIKGVTAHFGLTVIDLNKLKKVPKPWFMSTPDANGDWSNDKVDDDVHFWLKWKEAGNSVWFDPEVRLGHVEEMVVMHDENLKPVHVYPNEWEAIYAPRTNPALEELQAGAKAD